MTAEHIRRLASEGEGLTIEYKECANALNNSVFETVCSFSNRYGGHLLVGVHDSGEILGVNPKCVLDMKNNFVNVLNNPNKIAPTMYLSLTDIEVDGKIVLYVYVPQSSQIQLCSGRLFDRNFEGDLDITNSGELAAQLISRKSGQFTERRIFPYVTLEDIRLDLVPMAKRLALSRNDKHPWANMSDMELFKSAGLYDEDKMSGNKGFNLAGILLFAKDDVIHSCAPGYVTDCLLRRDNLDRYDDRLIVDTNLIEAYDKVCDFIEKHTLDRFHIIGRQSVSLRSLIVREIVSNILAHREFTSSYRARVIIERDRIVTDNWSRPQFAGRIDPNDFTPRSKNPTLARFFVNIGRADELGSGVRNLYEYTRIYTNGGEPELIEGNVFKTIVPIALQEDKAQMEAGLKSNHCASNCALNCALNCTLNCALTETETEIMAFLKCHPSATQKEVASAVTKSVNTVKNATVHLQELGLLKRDGAKKNGRWIVLENE